MSKKSIIYFIMLAVTPYLAIIPLILLFVGSDRIWQLFGDNFFFMAIPVALFIMLTGLLTIICFIKSLKNKWDAYTLAKTMATIKTIHIPAYIAIFVVGLFCLMTIFSYPFAIFLALFDFIMLLMSSAMSSSAVLLAARENPQAFSKYLPLILLQFIYCADVVATWILYLKLKKEKELKALPNEENL